VLQLLATIQSPLLAAVQNTLAIADFSNIKHGLESARTKPVDEPACPFKHRNFEPAIVVLSIALKDYVNC
jgi:hypothetical protein